MKKNMGTVDRVVRVALAVMFVSLIFAGQVQGTLAVIMGVLAAVFVITSVVAFCPLYLPFGISTHRKQ
jgi:K+-transporting ATPase A subunit